jgi:hypothetical protein
VRPLSLDLSSDGGYVIAGYTNSRDGDVVGLHQNVDATDFWLVKLGTGILSTLENKYSTDISIYPNPTKNTVTFSENLNHIEISTLEGRVVLTKPSGNQVDLHLLPASAYILKGVKKDGSTFTKKIIKQ